MTEAELFASWTRYMHRNDITADLPTVRTYADEAIAGRLLFNTIDLDDILANHPRMHLHAGLMYLHELAQDDPGLSREAQTFENAAASYSMRRSLTDNPSPVKMEAS